MFRSLRRSGRSPDQIVGFDMFLSSWGAPGIAHTISSWEFADGQHLAISIETRKEKGEEYSALLGFFRQFELYYVVADERDVIGVRAGPRRETLHLYRIKGTPAFARALLLDYLREVNRLTQAPMWYNALTHNCTTMILHHIQQIAPGNPFDWRILANGYLDQLGYQRGQIQTNRPFAELAGAATSRRGRKRPATGATSPRSSARACPSGRPRAGSNRRRGPSPQARRPRTRPYRVRFSAVFGTSSGIQPPPSAR